MSKAKIIAGVIALILFGIGIWIVTVIASPITGKAEAYKQINSANNQLAQYDHFFALDADIKSQATNAAAAKSAVDQFNKQYPPSPSESFSVTEQRNNLQANATGLVQLCTQNVNQYNNDAASYTKGQFQDSKLPWNENPAACTDPSLLPTAPQK
jgi:cytoskeletal protein RodZ